MNREDALRIHLLCADYLAAIEQQNFAAMEKLWALTERYPGLDEAFHELHIGLLEEHDEQIRDELKQVVQQTLPSATVIDPLTKGITVSEVMSELNQSRLFDNATELKDLLVKLNSSRILLPDELGYSRLSQWCMEHFGKGTTRLWQAFQQAALKVKLRQDAGTHYSLAARKAPPPQG